MNCNPRLVGSTHPGSCNFALGGICAYKQGKFDIYHDRVFSTEFRNPKLEDVLKIGSEIGLDTAALKSCIDDPQTKAELAREVDEANRLGVNATPTVYVNNKKLPRLADFPTIVDNESRKKGFIPLGQ